MNTADKLLLKARHQAGLDDFGFACFEQDFYIFIQSVEAQGNILPTRQRYFDDYIVGILVNRLRFVEDLKHHPEISQQLLRPPVVITSMPRTGSSKLQRMLAATDSFQAVRYWHIYQFARIPGCADGGIEQRIQKTRDFERWTNSTVPGFLQGHPMLTEEAEEEPILMESSFRSSWLACNFNAPDYLAHLMTTDHSDAYDYLALQLKYLQWQFYADNVRPYVLKSPGNLGNESQLQRIYPPGIKFIMTHRSVEQTVASATKVFDLLKQRFNGAQDKLALGQFALQMFSSAMQQHLQWRKNNPEAEILDVAFNDLCNDPIAVAERVYDFLRMEFSGTIADQIRRWNQANPRDKHGKNAYSSAMYGIEPHALARLFEEYSEGFAQYL